MNRAHSGPSFTYRKRHRERILRKMTAMRAAKERKRLAMPSPEPEPKMLRFHRLALGLYDKTTGETAWVDFKSIRDTLRRLSVIKRFYLA